jgi:1-hydroxycarotenoid 3,4-desaturase
MTNAPVVVVGAGIGGLACALRLASTGADVIVLERATRVGGKLREVEVDGQRLDAGPTVLTMRWVFEALFEDAGARLCDWLTLTPARVLARHAWDDRAHFDLHADLDRTADAIGVFFGATEAVRYRAFCERARSIYRTLEQPFLRAAQPNPVSLAKRVGWRGLGDLMRISPFATMWSELSDYFHDPRLRQLFGRYATYCGSSPFLAPATLMLIAHVERDGVWMVDGGMRRIADALADLLRAQGGRIRCGAEVERIVVDGGRAAAVLLADGERIAARAVVFNGDSAALANGLLGPSTARSVPATRPEQRSLSAITWHLRARTGGFPLVRHGVFFGGDSRREFHELFGERTLPSDPTVYVCAQDRDRRDELASRTLDEPERLMCLVNAPANADTATDTGPLGAEEIERCESRMLKRLAACGLHLEPSTTAPVLTTPQDFARMFPATGGALYGRATHGWAASFERPSSRSRIPGLYLAGGSVHPGAGLPMAALSGRLAADCVTEDLATKTSRASMSMSRPAVTRGGISTR